MKILYIIKAFAMKAGVERVVSDKMNWLAKHGYEVSLVTYEQGDHPYAFPLHETVRHYRLDARFFKLNQMSIWKRPYEMYQMRKRFKNGLQQAVDEEHPDFIICTTYSIKVLDIILKIRTKAHRIIESHIALYTLRKAYDYRNHILLRNIATIFDKWAFRNIGKFEKLIVLTHGDAQDWSKYVNDVTIIPNPVTNYPEKIKPHDGTGHRIICVGRLYEQKGFDLLIEAFSLIANKYPDWYIDIFGSGEDEQKLRVNIAEHGLNKRIHILPPSNHIYEEYQKSEFYVLSSRYEGYPLVLNEAMSCGIPCVAFRCKYGPEEAIINGENGLLAVNGNVKNLSQQMQWMIDHPQERISMGHAARITARRYLLETIMKKWESLFNELILY